MNGIVIDADVARSSGTSEHPRSSSSRSLLDRVLDCGKEFAFCPKLREEWKRHASNYSTKWLTAMIARKRVRFVIPASEFEVHVRALGLEEELENIVLKDSHLIDSALHNGKLLASFDDLARDACSEIAVRYHPIRDIKWINPVSHARFVEQGFALRPEEEQDLYLDGAVGG